jgi:hypothetical protein
MQPSGIVAGRNANAVAAQRQACGTERNSQFGARCPHAAPIPGGGTRPPVKKCQGEDKIRRGEQRAPGTANDN